MNERVLVTGGSGFVMSSIHETLENNGLDMVAPSENELDFTDIKAVKYFIKSTGCKVFLHAGAYTNVPLAKKEYSLAKQINGEGTKNVAIACEEGGIKMVLLSTDFIFPGNSKNPGPYTEDARRPESHTSADLGHYGSTKLLAEFQAQHHCSNLAIVRLSYPFGSQNEKDYIFKLTKSICEGRGLFTDQYITPTYLPDLAVAISKIVKNNEKGIFHAACSNYTTPYELGRYVATILEMDYEIKRGSCTDYLRRPEVDPVPQFGGLNTILTEKRLGIKFHTWQNALEKYLD